LRDSRAKERWVISLYGRAERTERAETLLERGRLFPKISSSSILESSSVLKQLV
jgi:hypothetical protein